MSSPRPTISLTTDFGTSDPYVGVMKGVIAGICPEANVIDITHDIPPQNISAAAVALASAWRFFPPDTVHVAVVDPGVGSTRRAVAARFTSDRYHRHYFLAPDNGLLSGLLETKGETEARWVENRSLFLAEVSDTFHGRDVFAPVAARLAAGLTGLESLGPVAPRDDWSVAATPPRPQSHGPGTVRGHVIAIDHFGNLITNLRREHVASNSVIEFGGRTISGCARTYNEVARGEPVALIGSNGYLEISINCGSAARTFGTTIGMEVSLESGT